MHSIIRSLLDRLPSEADKNLVAILTEAYETASSEAKKIKNKKMRVQQLSHLQRFHSERALEKWASSIRGKGIKLQCTGTSNNSYKFFKVHCGVAILTFKRLSYRGETLRTADFRDNLSRSNQCWLLEDLIPNDRSLPHIVVLHGPEEKCGEQLGFVRFALPVPGRSVFLEDMYLPLTSLSAIESSASTPEQPLQDARPTPKQQKQRQKYAG